MTIYVAPQTTDDECWYCHGKVNWCRQCSPTAAVDKSPKCSDAYVSCWSHEIAMGNANRAADYARSAATIAFTQNPELREAA